MVKTVFLLMLILIISYSTVRSQKQCDDLINSKEGESWHQIYLKYVNQLVYKCDWSVSNNEKQILVKDLIDKQSNVKIQGLTFWVLANQKKEIKESVKDQLLDYCLNLWQVVDNTGSIYESLKDKNVQTSNFKQAAMVMTNQLECLQIMNEDQKQQQLVHWQRLFKGILTNSQELDEHNAGLFESKDNLIVLIQTLLPMDQLQNYVQSELYDSFKYKYLNFIRSNVLYNSYIQTLYDFKQLAAYFSKYPFIQNPINIVDQSKAVLSFVNLNDQIINDPTLNIQSVLVDNENKKTKLTFKLIDDQYVAQIDRKSLQSGVYEIQYVINNKHKQKQQLILREKLSIKGVSQKIIQSNTQQKRQLNVALEGIEDKIYKGSEKSQIHIQLDLNQEMEDIELVGLKLVHEQFQNSSNLIRMRRDKSMKSSYKGILDLGDADHIVNINGIYHLEVIVSDVRLLQQIKQRIMTIDISFKRSVDKVNSDLDHILLPHITHVFRPDVKPVNIIITSSFSSILIIIFISYLVINLLNNKTSFANLSIFKQFLFILLILSWVALLVLFWVQINLMQFGYYSFIFSIVTIFIGNQALSDLNK